MERDDEGDSRSVAGFGEVIAVVPLESDGVAGSEVAVDVVDWSKLALSSELLLTAVGVAVVVVDDDDTLQLKGERKIDLRKRLFKYSKHAQIKEN